MFFSTLSKQSEFNEIRNKLKINKYGSPEAWIMYNEFQLTDNNNRQKKEAHRWHTEGATAM